MPTRRRFLAQVRRKVAQLFVTRGLLKEARSPLCARDAGFSLHARTRVQRHRRGDLEVLCRYVARPPLANDQLELRDDGKVELTFSRPWSDGTTSLAFEPLTGAAPRS